MLVLKKNWVHTILSTIRDKSQITPKLEQHPLITGFTNKYTFRSNIPTSFFNSLGFSHPLSHYQHIHTHKTGLPKVPSFFLKKKKKPRSRYISIPLKYKKVLKNYNRYLSSWWLKVPTLKDILIDGYYYSTPNYSQISAYHKKLNSIWIDGCTLTTLKTHPLILLKPTHLNTYNKLDFKYSSTEKHNLGQLRYLNKLFFSKKYQSYLTIKAPTYKFLRPKTHLFKIKPSLKTRTSFFFNQKRWRDVYYKKNRAYRNTGMVTYSHNLSILKYHVQKDTQNLLNPLTEPLTKLMPKLINLITKRKRKSAQTILPLYRSVWFKVPTNTLTRQQLLTTPQPSGLLLQMKNPKFRYITKPGLSSFYYSLYNLIKINANRGFSWNPRKYEHHRQYWTNSTTLFPKFVSYDWYSIMVNLPYLFKNTYFNYSTPKQPYSRGIGYSQKGLSWYNQHYPQRKGLRSAKRIKDPKNKIVSIFEKSGVPKIFTPEQRMSNVSRESLKHVKDALTSIRSQSKNLGTTPYDTRFWPSQAPYKTYFKNATITRFKPGYYRYMRKIRANFLKASRLHYFRQRRLTTYFLRFKDIKYREFFYDMSLSLLNIVTSSSIFPSEAVTNYIIKLKSVFINGVRVLDPKTRVFVGDVISVEGVEGYYQYYLWLNAWHKKYYYRTLNSVFTRWVSPNSSFTNVNLPKNLSSKLNNVFSTNKDVPLWLEVDYLTISIVLLYYPKPYKNLLKAWCSQIPYTGMRVYNWKYIT